jgi:hypothetical protein
MDISMKEKPKVLFVGVGNNINRVIGFLMQRREEIDQRIDDLRTEQAKLLIAAIGQDKLDELLRERLR